MKNQQPAFVILTPGFPKDENDSTCLPAQQLFVRLLKEKFPLLDIVVLTFQYPDDAVEYNWHDCRVISLAGKGKGKFFRLLLWYKTWKKLQQLSKSSTIKGLLSFWCGECALVGKRFGKKYNIQHLCWILGQDAKKENKYVQRIKPRAGELIAMSDFLQETFWKNHAIKPAVVIPNGIDTRSFSKTIAIKDIDIMGAGNLIPLKQYDVFIGIISAIKKFFPGIKTVICGKGPEDKFLRSLIVKEGLQDNITLMNELPHAVVLQLMQRSRLFLHCALYEGFGSVCIEALYAGAQVISFNEPMKEKISHWHIAKNKEDMLQKVLSILQDQPIDNSPICPYLMEDSVTKMMQLFGH